MCLDNTGVQITVVQIIKVGLYLELFEFLDLQAQAAENTVGESECRRPVITPGKKNCLKTFLHGDYK